MALSESTEEDKIEIVGPYKAVQVRVATVIKKDGVEINRSFHRHVLQPSTKTGDNWADTDISDQRTEDKAICNSVWNDDVKKAYQTFIDSNKVT